VVILFSPTTVVDPVRPAPRLIIWVDGYFRITIPEPPAPPFPILEKLPPPPPPLPVFI
jgi:hypothetical protein